MADTETDERKYTTGAKAVQQMGAGVARAAQRVAQGVAEGFRVYQEKSEESADTKQDGAMRDLLTNSAEGLSAAMVVMSKAPLDIAKAMDSEAAWDAAQSVSRSVEKALQKDKKESDTETTEEDRDK